ncbi:MAG: hemerythrin domain-containing protein [Alphaproteobacteria bacterium]|nr:hemerythrin domain-containing protein [Alphaproteobacteria bacterium]
MAKTPAAKPTPPKRRAAPAAPRQRTVRKPDAVALLKEDHRAVEAKFERYEKIRERADDARKAALVAEICAALKLHTAIEEAVFYPAARAVMEDQDLLDEADVEHASAKELIAQLEAGSPADDHYDAKVKVLGEYVKHHVKEEERELFKEARKAGMDMRAVGDELRAARAEREPPRSRGRGAEQPLRG